MCINIGGGGSSTPAKTIKAPPPPEKAPSELEDAVDSNATLIKKKRSGTKQLRRKNNTGTNYQGTPSGGSGLTINK